MSTTTATRPLPVNTVIPVSGVSFRQDAVKTVVENDRLWIRHDTLNEHDPYACQVTRLDGTPLGFVPRHLAARLSGPHPGGVWKALVEEVLRGDTWGLRVRVGPLDHIQAPAVPGADAPGLRHAGDGVVEDLTAVVAADVPDPRQQPDAAPEPVTVYTKTGRALGVLKETTGTSVLVTTGDGREVRYPSAVITTTPPPHAVAG